MLKGDENKKSVIGYRSLAVGKKLLPIAYCLLPVLLLLTAHCLLLTAQAEVAEAIGKFTYVEGMVDVLREGKLPATPAKVGNHVFVKDILRTKSDSRAEITFNDGNTLRLAKRTRIDISEYVADTGGVINLPRGKAQAIVPKERAGRIAASPKALKFEIRTPNAVAGARGTDYITFHDRGMTGVLVIEGTVAVYNPKFPEAVVNVSAGQITLVPPDKPPAPPRPATETEIKGLTRDTMPIAVIREAMVASLPTPEVVAPPPSVSPVIVTETPATITQVVQPPPVTETVARDTTPPVVTITSTPPALTNAATASFSFSSDDPNATYTYSLDGNTVSSTDLTEVSEGSHTFAITSKDEMGNKSTASYTWTTDYTPPIGTLAISPRPRVVTGETSANFSFTATDTHLGKLYYHIDDGEWQILTDTLALTNIMEGKRTIEFKADDLVGNVSDITSYEWFIGTRQYVLQGGLTGDLSGSILPPPDSEGIRTTVSDQTVGEWLIESEGTYETIPASDWSASINADSLPVSINRCEISGTQWSDNKISGATAGYMADISSTPLTGIIVGETLGTFNPVDTTWQAVSLGVWLETKKFLEMAATPEGVTELQQLNIPSVEVGRATLAGSGNGFTDLKMTDTIFFAPSNGAAPKIWATGNVSGSYTSAPSIGIGVNLTGSGLNATFTPQAWDTTNNKWLSTVNGSGNLSGGSYIGPVNMMSGAGAGKIESAPSTIVVGGGGTSDQLPTIIVVPGTISGTAAGIAK